jgi:hypothetical protein
MLINMIKTGWICFSPNSMNHLPTFPFSACAAFSKPTMADRRSSRSVTGRNGFQGLAVDGAVGRQEFPNAHRPTQGEAQGSALRIAHLANDEAQ